MQINYRNCFYLGLSYGDIHTISLQFKYLFSHMDNKMGDVPPAYLH